VNEKTVFQLLKKHEAAVRKETEKKLQPDMKEVWNKRKLFILERFFLQIIASNSPLTSSSFTFQIVFRRTRLQFCSKTGHFKHK
jgi:hypothetical protein